MRHDRYLDTHPAAAFADASPALGVAVAGPFTGETFYRFLRVTLNYDDIPAGSLDLSLQTRNPGDAWQDVTNGQTSVDGSGSIATWMVDRRITDQELRLVLTPAGGATAPPAYTVHFVEYASGHSKSEQLANVKNLIGPLVK